MKTKHVIITRFNLGLWSGRGFKYVTMRKEYAYDKRHNLEWETKRLAIMKKFTVESLKNQTNKNFTWVILYDGATPKYNLQKIKECVEGLNVVFQPMNMRYRENIKFLDIRYFNELFKQDPIRFIYTDLDSDAMLPYDYIDQVQKEACATEDTVLMTSRKEYRVYITPNHEVTKITEKDFSELKFIPSTYSLSCCTELDTLHRRSHVKITQQLDKQNRVYKHIIANDYDSIYLVHDRNMWTYKNDTLVGPKHTEILDHCDLEKICKK